MIPPSAGRGMRVKICGLTRPQDVSAAVDTGASYLGFVFYPRSPRHVTPQEAAPLAASAPPGVAKVALLVDADDDAIDAVTATVPIDILQLHGRETPQRVAAVKARTWLPVMKAVGLSGPDDLAALRAHEAVADMVLVDAKPPAGGGLPGGNGLAFDWRLIAGRRWPRPWMLAGGLTPESVAEAIVLTGARQVDVSSGVEAAPGRKDPARIARFCAAAGCPARAAHGPSGLPSRTLL